MLQNSKNKIGIAPIGWTNDDMPALGRWISFEQCITEIAEAGYNGTEIGGKFPQEVGELKKQLKKQNLRIAGQWFSSYLCEKSYKKTENEFIQTLLFLQSIGGKCINICELTRCLFASKDSMFGEAKPVASANEWNALCTGLDSLGKVAKDYGIQLCFHHHMATIVQTLEETKRLMENTNPDYVSLCYDTGHFTFAGEDAVIAATTFASRIGHVHLKDIRPEKRKQAVDQGFWFRKAVLEGCFTVPGDGCVDFPAVLNVLANNEYAGWLLVEAEQDPQKAPPLEYAKMARAYIRRIANI